MSREIDKLVASKVMNLPYFDYVLERHPSGDTEAFTVYCDEVNIFRNGTLSQWSPSTDISAAWEVVEKMSETHCFWIERNIDDIKSPEWVMSYRTHFGHSDNGVIESRSAPLAICLAALRAVGAQSELDKIKPTGEVTP